MREATNRMARDVNVQQTAMIIGPLSSILSRWHQPTEQAKLEKKDKVPAQAIVVGTKEESC